MRTRARKLVPALAIGVVTGGCFDVETIDPVVDGVLLMPNDEGWIGREMNEIGIQGAWYAYGDQYGEAKCTNVGMHSPAECSRIDAPDPEKTEFVNEKGKMCTSGETAVIPGCPTCPDGYDYRNVWGAGIGLDLNTNPGQPGEKLPYDPVSANVVGVSFEIDFWTTSPLRVEFPIVLPEGSTPPTTQDHPDGSPYWGATDKYKPSPVKQGYNRFRWSDVKAPKGSYVFDPSKILAVQFHVPAVSYTEGSERRPYAFCIHNLTFLRE